MLANNQLFAEISPEESIKVNGGKFGKRLRKKRFWRRFGKVTAGVITAGLAVLFVSGKPGTRACVTQNGDTQCVHH
jgi:hypothetical protein